MPCYFGDDDGNPHEDCYHCDDCRQPICGGECADEVSGPHGCRCVRDAQHLYYCLVCQRDHAVAHGLDYGLVFPACGALISAGGLTSAIHSYLATETLSDDAPQVRAANLFLNTVGPGGGALLSSLRWVDDVRYQVDSQVRGRTGKVFVRLGAEFFAGGTPVRLALLAARGIGIAYGAGYRFGSEGMSDARNFAANAFAGWVATGERPTRAANRAWVEAALGPAETAEDERLHTRTVQWLDSVFLESLPDAGEISRWFVADAVAV